MKLFKRQRFQENP